MKDMMIELTACTEADEGCLLRTAAKILEDLRAMDMPCRVNAAAPGSLTMAVKAKDRAFAGRQVFDLADGRRVRASITDKNP